MKIIELLKKNNLLSSEILLVDYHMNLLNCHIGYLKNKIEKLNGKNDEEVLDYIIELYKKCDQTRPEYDEKLDEEMTRIGLNVNSFPGPHHNKNIWNNGFFEDDGFGFGTEITSIYDKYVDSLNDKELDIDDVTKTLNN